MSEISELIEREEQEIVCENCGAHFNIHAPKCPFCGTVNEYGDEEEYLKDLEAIRIQLESTKNIPREAMAKEAKFQGKRAMKVLIAVLVLVIIAVVAFLLINALGEKKEEEEQRAQWEWQQTNFAMLDEWFEEGRYDEIVDFEYDMYLKNDELGTEYHLWNWNHYDWLCAYGKYKMFSEYFEDGHQPEDIQESEKVYMFYDAMYILFEPWEIRQNVVRSLPEEDYQMILGYQEDVRTRLKQMYGLNDAEIDNLEVMVTFDSPGVGVEFNKCEDTYQKLFANVD